MTSISLLTTFFGWASVINMAILALASLMIVAMRRFLLDTHGAMFDLDETDLHRAYFQYLAQYKIAIFVFNLTPYLALKIIAA